MSDETGHCRDGTIRGQFVFDCIQRDCGKSWSGDGLASIAQSVARHWNREHGDDLRLRYEAIDEVQTGGHHIQGHAYEVRKYKVYLTSFDVMERIGQVDGYAVAGDDDRVCDECLRQIPDANDRLEDEPEDSFNDDWTCRACIEEAELKRKKQQNQSLGEFVTDGGYCVQPDTDHSGGEQ